MPFLKSVSKETKGLEAHPKQLAQQWSTEMERQGSIQGLASHPRIIYATQQLNLSMSAMRFNANHR
jgi:hypothetical protein